MKNIFTPIKRRHYPASAIFKYAITEYTIGKVFALHIEKGYYWFRIFGRGIHWHDMKKHGLTFSQRMNISRYFKIGNWIIIPSLRS